MTAVGRALSLALIIAAEPVNASPCSGDSTPEIENCLHSQLEAREGELGHYIAVASQRITTLTDNPNAVPAFLATQPVWLKYRQAECDAVYEYWRGGSIRGIKALICSRHLTEIRTHEVWATWLTFGDSTPPVLPEPAVGAGP